MAVMVIVVLRKARASSSFNMHSNDMTRHSNTVVPSPEYPPPAPEAREKTFPPLHLTNNLPRAQPASRQTLEADCRSGEVLDCSCLNDLY